MSHLRYLRYVALHKLYVFQMGWRLGIPFLAALHDNSKFLPSEWFPYVASFYGKAGRTPEVREAFDWAWLLHQKRNKHHWQAWLLVHRDLHNCPKRPATALYDGRLIIPFEAPPVMVPPATVGLLREDDGDLRCLLCYATISGIPDSYLVSSPMPEKYWREMLADWWGAGKAQGKHSPKDNPWRETRAWYHANKAKMQMHPDTRFQVERLMCYDEAMGEFAQEAKRA